MKATSEQNIKNALKDQGIDIDSAPNINMNELEEIALSCSSVEEAIEKICEKNPQIDAEHLKNDFANLQFNMLDNESSKTDSMSEEAIELDEDDLEAVAGGSVGSWFKKNWPAVLAITAVCVGVGYGAHKLMGSGVTSKAIESGTSAASGATASGATAAGAATSTGAAAGAAEASGSAASGSSGGMGMGTGIAFFAMQAILPTLMSD